MCVCWGGGGGDDAGGGAGGGGGVISDTKPTVGWRRGHKGHKPTKSAKLSSETTTY